MWQQRRCGVANVFGHTAQQRVVGSRAESACSSRERSFFLRVALASDGAAAVETLAAGADSEAGTGASRVLAVSEVVAEAPGGDDVAAEDEAASAEAGGRRRGWRTGRLGGGPRRPSQRFA